MDEGDRDLVLREMNQSRAARVIAAMEPDEAAEALRSFPDADRAAFLASLPADVRERVAALVDYAPDTAGGIMTTTIVLAHASDTVARVVGWLADDLRHAADIAGVLVVDDDGRLVDDISLFEMLTADRSTPMSDLVAPPWPVAVDVETPLADVVDALLSNRSTSVVVLDGEGRPIGRILSDDVLDALAPSRRGLVDRR
jgi:Mg/Co/Ni transporter MgtE